MTKHTPGPWEVSGRIDARYLSGVGDVVLIRRNDSTDNRYVGMASLDAMGRDNPGAETTPEEAEANARLIAAAPELLAVAQSLISYADNGSPIHPGPLLDIVTNARAAIAKAKGE